MDPLPELRRFWVKSFVSQKLKFVPFWIEHLYRRHFRMHHCRGGVENLRVQNFACAAFNECRADLLQLLRVRPFHCQQRFALAQRLLYALAFGNVNHRADVAEEIAVYIQTRRSSVDRPAVFAVFAAEAIIYPKRFVFFIRDYKRLFGLLLVIGMDRLKPAESQAGLRSLAGKVVPGFAEKATGAVRFTDPDHDRPMISHVAESCLAL